MQHRGPVFYLYIKIFVCATSKFMSAFSQAVKPNLQHENMGTKHWLITEEVLVCPRIVWLGQMAILT